MALWRSEVSASTRSGKFDINVGQFLHLPCKTISQMFHDEQLLLIEGKLTRAKQARYYSDDLLRSMGINSRILLLSRLTSFCAKESPGFLVADKRAVERTITGDTRAGRRRSWWPVQLRVAPLVLLQYPRCSSCIGSSMLIFANWE
jgi:hypothetical protein